MTKMVTTLAVALLLVVCAPEVGGDAWCEDMDKKAE